MPFQKGHQIKGNPTGVSKEHRRALKSLALEWRENTDFGDIRARLISFAQGRNPSTGEPVDPTVSLKAMEILLNRTHGQAAQFVVLDQTIRSEMQPQARSRYEELSLAEIRAQREKLLAAGARRKVIDAESAPVSSGTDDDV